VTLGRFQLTVTEKCIYPRLYFKLNNIWIQSWLFIIIFSGSAAQRGLWLPRSRGFLTTHNDGHIR
jgi:hypothetical protein